MPKYIKLTLTPNQGQPEQTLSCDSFAILHGERDGHPRSPTYCLQGNNWINSTCLDHDFLSGQNDYPVSRVKNTIADSAQTEYCSTFHCSSVRPCVTGVTSHISHIYKGINAMLIIRAPSTHIYSESKSSWLSF